MRRCPICDSEKVHDTWNCISCGWIAAHDRGVPIFAPGICGVSEGYDPTLYEELASLEAGNFWFSARNRLINCLVKRHLPQTGCYLELGCGTGFVLQMIQRVMPDWAISASETLSEGLEFAKKRVGSTINFYQMDACAVPFKDEFDVIGAFDVIEHIRDDVGAIAQAHTALKPGGFFILSVPQHMFLWSKYDEASHHFRRYSEQELRQKLEASGFSIQSSTSFNSLLLPLMLLSRIMKTESDKKGTDVLKELKLSRWANQVLSVIIGFEYILFRLGVRFSIGGSRVVIAQKLLSTE